MWSKLTSWARKLKKQIFILYFAYQDERVTWPVKIFTAVVVAYAFSPIDLIPDFIPILGYLDDIILVPLGIMLALKMLPGDVIADSSAKAENWMLKEKPKNWIAGTIILLLWTFILLWIFLTVAR